VSPPDPQKPCAAASRPAETPRGRVALDARSVRTIVFGVMLAMFLSALDQTIVATALPAIGRELRSVENLSWAVAAYLLSATAVTPLYGKLSDIYGRRAVLLGGIGLFVAGSIACALSQTMSALILARAVQGLGGGGLIALSQTIIADIMAPRERALWQAYFGIVFATANISGAVLGGLFAQYLHWSLIFWINVPLGLAAFAMTYRALAALPPLHRHHRLDVLGAVLMASATVTLLLALTWGGTRYPWGSPVIVTLIAASAALWALFALRLATASEPFLPLAVLGNAIVRNSALSAFFGMGTIIGLSIYIPVYLQAVIGLDSATAGLGLIPLFGCGVIGATISGRSIAYVKNYKRIPLVGLVCGAIALAILASQPAGLPLGVIAALLGVTGLATGSLFPVSTVSLQNAVHPHQLGTATASLNFFRQLGGAILVAGFGTILITVAGLAGGRPSDLVTRAAAEQQAALVSAFAWVFAAAAFGLAAAFFFLLLMEQRPLGDRPHGDRAGDPGGDAPVR
jgi:EmrB/QacA subfamily drug resistance transporter